MNRELFKGPFRKEGIPSWVCPTCETGAFTLKKESFLIGERFSSRTVARSDYEESPPWTDYVYSCLFQCMNGRCKEFVSSSGTVRTNDEISYNENGGMERDIDNYFQPLFFEPALKIIAVPSDCPDTVSDQIEESFRLFFVSPSATANSIRIAVEKLLTELNVKRFEVKKNKRHYLSLHQRIGLLPDKHSELKEVMKAIKWLGNNGSHGSDLGVDDVLDGYEFLEHVLQEIYESKAKKLNAKARKINKKKGSVRK